MILGFYILCDLLDDKNREKLRFRPQNIFKFNHMIIGENI